MVYGHGINDTSRGWMTANDKNQRIYRTWKNMLCRCYSEKYQEKHPTYKGCSVCNNWLMLSNFIRDLKFIDGYDEEKFLNGNLCLDKDIKSNGENKEYSLNNCLWVSSAENIRQAIKTREDNYFKNKNNPCSIKIAQYDKNGNIIKIWSSSREIQRELGINQGDIITCCKWYACGEDLEEFHKIRKGYPHKTVKNFIFKYAEEC